ncbi:MAG: Uncharacterised protein [Chloroflexota bacterium]|nr:MAG: Uncharacterised protein [Chloroflexota bacterium]
MRISSLSQSDTLAFTCVEISVNVIDPLILRVSRINSLGSPKWIVINLLMTFSSKRLCLLVGEGSKISPPPKVYSEDLTIKESPLRVGKGVSSNIWHQPVSPGLSTVLSNIRTLPLHSLVNE